MILKYGIQNDEPVVHTWVRKNGLRVQSEHEFLPYFYVHRNVDVEAALGDALLPYVRRVEDTDRVAIDGTPLKKVVTYLPKHVPIVRDSLAPHYEADIPFTTRYMLDRISLDDFGEPYRPMYIDIELGAPASAGIDAVDQFPVLCMSTIYEGELKTFLLKGGDEHTLLMNFLTYFIDCNPDVICGWNIPFDIRVLIQRLGGAARYMSPLGYVSSGVGGPLARDPDIPGRIIFDLCAAYKILKEQAAEKPRNYSLNTVGAFEFGAAWEMPAWSRRILEVYNADPNSAMEYNVRHTKLCKMIDDRFRILETFSERQKTALCEFRDTMHASMMFDRLLLRRSPFALPSKPKVEESAMKKAEGYTGAVVFDPIPGLHKDVALFDFRSLYPSIVISLNVSPETLCFIDGADYKLAEVGIGFRAQPVGLMPSILRDLLDRRAEARALSKERGDAYDLKQLALKILANAAYGSFAFIRFRLYNRNIAQAITCVGRAVIRAVKQLLESLGFKVIYGDTDSLFVVGVTDPSSLIPLINEFVEKFMRETFGVQSCAVEIELDSVYRSLFFGLKKKRYMGITESGKMTIKGFEVKRRDCPKFGVDLQREVMKAILDGKSESEVLALAKGVYKGLVDGTLPLKDVGVPKRLSAPIFTYKRGANDEAKFAWVRAIERTNRLFPVAYTGQEDELMFFHTEQGILAAVPEDFDRVRSVELDFGHLVKVGILNRLSPFLAGMEWTAAAKEFKLWIKAGGHKQGNLDRWMT